MSYVAQTAGQSACYYGEPHTGCGTARGNAAVSSKANAAPINYVTRDEAEGLCSNSTYLKDQSGNALSNGHLLSVALWKKVADDLAAQGTNWSSGNVGNGYMSRGYANYSADEPTTCDQATNASRACPSKADGADAGSTVGNPSGLYAKRVWQMSDGSVIHDFAGNVWEWYYDLHNYGGTAAWQEFTDNGATNYTYAGASIEPSTTTWNSAHGVGKTYSPGASVPTATTYAARFGGNWSNAAGAGVFASYWSTDSPSSSRHYDVGFRCIVPAR